MPDPYFAEWGDVLWVLLIAAGVVLSLLQWFISVEKRNRELIRQRKLSRQSLKK
jgi:hypothetical protein